jgi:hypothetical protein
VVAGKVVAARAGVAGVAGVAGAEAALWTVAKVAVA